jgi:hypothetical protein
MKITPELLKDLGFEQQKKNNGIEIDEWRMKMHGYLFTVKGNAPVWRFYSPGSYEPHCHHVTDVEEIFGFLCEDMWHSGFKAAKQEIREWLSRDEKPCQKFNLVVYYHKNQRLIGKGEKPIFHENVYIYSGDGGYLYAYDAVKFDKQADSYWMSDDDEEDEDYTVEIMDQVISTAFKYCGIWVHGLEHVRRDNRDSCETNWYQTWLITNLSREELEKENWYGY